MPLIDDGPGHGSPGRPLRSAWVTMSPDEAVALFEALGSWVESARAGTADSGWHTHVVDDDGNELTLAILPPEDETA